MELYIFDQSRTLAGVVEAFEYLRWTRRYYTTGSFEVKAAATDSNLALLKIGNILWKSGDGEAGYIELLELSMDGREYITASGRFLTSLLARRILWTTETLRGELSEMIGQLLAAHIISPADPARKIDRLSYQASPLGIRVDTQISYQNLLTAVSGLCETADIGIRTNFHPADGTAQITLYQGGGVQGIFSREYENVLEQTFTQSVMNYANIALVGGEGEGPERTFITVGSGGGESRYEMFVDAKDLRSEDFPDNYAAALAFRGNEKLAEQAMIKAFEATLNQYGNLRYKTDFDVGSRVRVVSARWGLSMTARITELSESYGRDGMSLEAVLGKALLTLQKQGGV